MSNITEPRPQLAMLPLMKVSETGGNIPTMSSLEIAELMAKEHKNVIRDIRAMLTGLNSEPSNFESSYRDSTGRTLPCFNLPKRETLILVSGYDVRLRARIIDRWQELEAGQAAARPLDYSDPKVVLGVLEHLSGKVAEQQLVIDQQGERLRTLDRLEHAQGSMCITDAAKTLGTGRKELIDFLSSRGWIFKRPGNRNWLAYHARIAAGHMEHDDHIFMDDQGRERVATRALVTAKGLVRISEMLSERLH